MTLEPLLLSVMVLGPLAFPLMELEQLAFLLMALEPLAFLLMALEPLALLLMALEPLAFPLRGASRVRTWMPLLQGRCGLPLQIRKVWKKNSIVELVPVTGDLTAD
jgi:hypothetical protein